MFQVILVQPSASEHGSAMFRTKKLACIKLPLLVRLKHFNGFDFKISSKLRIFEAR